MQVKAQGLLHAAMHIEETYGRDVLVSVLRATSPPVRETYTSAIAINWHTVEEQCEFVDVAEAQLGNRSGKLAKAIGAAGARASLKGVILQVALYLTKPAFLMSRFAGMWRQFNDEGSLDLLNMTTARATIELRGIKKPMATLCQVVTGWIDEVTHTLGFEVTFVQHTECRARGNARCIWEVKGERPPEPAPSTGG